MIQALLWFGVSLWSNPVPHVPSGWLVARGFQPTAVARGKVIRKSEALDIFDHGVPGIAILADDELAIVYGPNEYTVSFPVTHHVVDFAIDRELPTKGPDGIFSVDNSELKAWTYDGSAFQDQTIGGAWSAPMAVRSQTQPNGSRLVVVLDPDGTAFPGLYAQKVYTALPEIFVGSNIIDFALSDFDGNGTPDIAVLRNHDFEIYDLGGAKLLSTAVARGAGHLLVLEETVMPRIALIRNDPMTSNSEVFVLGVGGVEPLLKIPGDRVTAASAGDLNQDGLDDLILAVDTRTELLLLENTGMTGASFSLLPNFSASATAPGAAQVSSMLTHDLDWDGDADVIIARRDKISLFRSPSKNELELRPLVSRNIKGLEIIGDTVLRVNARPPRSLGNATHLRFTLWEGPAQGPLSTTPVDAHVTPLAGASWPIGADLSLLPSPGPGAKKYILEVRLLSATHTQSYPATLLEIAAPPSAGDSPSDSRSSRGFKVPGSTPVPFIPPFTSAQVPPTPWI